ncbi:DMT family transporter [Paraglaciecola sp. 2405UD69-4]|uniref:DMT family transporter n=1 Tax=Paraglaciecola sp. 2405UD69-4 TaxID=3391836 RepID=UPI0039C9DBD9
MLKVNQVTTAIISIIIASLFWGTTGTAASFTPDVSPLAVGAFSMGFGGVLLLLSGYKNVCREYKAIQAKSSYLVIGGLAIAIYPLAFYMSMKYSGVAIGTVISIASAPLFSVLLERLINHKPIKLQWTVSFIIGVIGVFFIASGKHASTTLEISSNTQYLGILLGLLAGLTYATYSWAAKQMITNNISSQSAVASMFGLAATLLLPSLYFTADNLFANYNNTLVALYMAVIPMFFGYLLFGYGLRHLDVSTATLITLIEPVIATLLAIVIVGETFSLIGWVGMFFIAICLVLQMLKVPPKVNKA